ncbi:MAG TPA: DUF177 domain-containing protein [Patescibacteria group bacterium]|nr:DUF177 domain-containing protein [Patescibacteria group bacterium]
MTGRDPRGRGSVDPDADAPLVWNVAGLLADGIGAARDFAVAGVEIDGGDDFQLAAPIDGSVRVSRTNRGLLVDATFRTVLAMECVRCLRPITVPLSFEIQDEALPSLDLKTGKAARLSAEDEETGVIVLTDHHELDLEPAIRDAILLSEPTAPVDREDCPGLCIMCGLPLDVGDHDHPEDDIDPRLEALRGFVAE